MEGTRVEVEPRFTVLGLRVDAISCAEAVDVVEGWITAGERRYVCLANVHAVVERLKDPSLWPVYREAGLCLPDGVPLVWLGRRSGRAATRVYGPDLTQLLCARAALRGWGVYLYGGAPGVAEHLGRALTQRSPGLRVVGAASPPFRALTPAEDEEAVRDINASGAHVVLVGLGCPKQERWLADHRSRLSAPVLMAVGAAFDFHTGRVRQAPRWMMSAGLEWLFRLYQEPRRLWHRYLVYNPLFLWHVLLEELRLRRYPR
jgi:N-acetylglucosaminyldiphosphoundecaprenol N-acetyl-beta-D-mannosaminyltransferase